MAIKLSQKEISLDLQHQGFTNTIYAQQGDINSRRLTISLFDDGKNYNIPKNAIVSLCGTRADNAVIYRDVNSFNKNIVVIDFEDLELAVKGIAKYKVEIKTTDNGKTQLLSSFGFKIKVYENIYDEDGKIASPQYSDLQRELDKIHAQESAIEQAETNRINAENNRIAEENKRQQQESVRVESETQRNTNETKRQEDTATAVYNAEKATNEATLATENCKEITSQAEDALQNQIQLNETLDIATQIKNDVTNMQSVVLDAKIQVEQDKAEIDDTIKNSLLASSEDILDAVKDYFTRAQALYDSMYLDCDGETPQLRVVTLIKIKGGTPQQRLIDGGISFDGGTPTSRLLGA